MAEVGDTVEWGDGLASKIEIDSDMLDFIHQQKASLDDCRKLFEYLPGIPYPKHDEIYFVKKDS